MAKYQTIQLRSGETIRLTEKELMFCEYYLGDCNKNATQSAIRAGLSEETARSQGQRMLTKVDIQKYIQDKTAPILEALGITQERIIKRLADIAFTDLKDLVDEDWTLRKPEDIDPRHHGAISSVEIETVSIMKGEAEVTKKKFKLKQSEKALLTLAEMVGLIDRRPAAAPAAPPTQIQFNQINNYVKEK